MLKRSYLIVILLALLASACTPGAATEPAATAAPTTAVPLPTDAPLETAVPTVPAEVPTATAEEPVSSSTASYVLFDKEAGMLRIYNLDGSLRYESAAPELEYPGYYNISVVKDAVYYSTTGQNPTIYRASAAGATKLSLVVEKLSLFRVSPDEQWIAWSVFHGDTTPPSSQLFVGSLDGQGGVQDAREVASFNLDDGQAFWAVPLKWAEDQSGLLYYERSLSGLGGYILYAGSFSLYAYDTASGQTTTYVGVEENRNICLDTYRTDLQKVVFSCGPDGALISVRNLSDGKETVLPMLPEQGAAGSSEFSPSGQWLAYAIARNNPDDELGKLVIVPADLSVEPQVIYQPDYQAYPVVQGWLDEDTLLVTMNNFAGPANTLLTIRRDGSQVNVLNSGTFVGWVK